MSSPVLDLDGISVPQEQILGYGRSGLVIRVENTALKIPLRYIRSSDDEVEINTEVIQREQEAYRRLGQCEGVVACLEMSEKSTRLALMENGDLRSYITKIRPSRLLQLFWFRETAFTLSRIHDRRVIVADVSSRNLLLDADLSIKICDFTESSILPLTANIEAANDNGYSIQTDIGQLGAVMYEVITGEQCEFNLFGGEVSNGRAAWPRRETLPNTQNVWLGPIIARCWTEGGFRNVHCLLEALESAACLEEHPTSKMEVMGRWLHKAYAMFFNT
ncbi:serine/threonine protein kinase [Trichophyton rubrum D6]|nr:serine/threonine protein kinase [Trichophyton rubrum CBS 118892]EZF25602.1 serine/threonine protein kinase [Trichophyton rubrum MR850]EZF44568.1 serine/threonine protein kinase [Trichophyton rubrum CBS 100081]EZF55205.1 serine/threonine protein kinase [Trichophyton rubrum CBS 288.86]EZF65840.1 serine/threonine protein kinase [Trichophyton rubrum CBS 289.86]EZF76423.1 serine/threonine protein kinase [Trichophyton soudanense CBS 452.61]EZF87100.1 serine/threonine protein kinase [Trichophyton